MTRTLDIVYRRYGSVQERMKTVTVKEYNQYGEFIEKTLRLDTYPLAIKWFAHGEALPEKAIRPMRDLGKHMAFCQAKAMARMRGMTIAMAKEDHWCWNPLISFGMVDCRKGSKEFEIIKKYIGVPPEKADDFLEAFPRLELGKYEYVVVSPLKDAEFEPDMILIYSNTMQLNCILRAVKMMTGTYLKSEFDCIDSCTYSTVPPFYSGEYRITVPDPGDVERARAGKDEMIFSVPPQRLQELCTGLEAMDKRGLDYRHAKLCMPLDFERPPFYNEIFEMWGLDKGTDW